MTEDDAGGASDDTIELTIEALAFGGDAVGRDRDGRVVFVPGGAPGDRVRVRLTEHKRKYARGQLTEVVHAGERVAPPCPYASSCGGCPWMHVEDRAQLRAKQEVVSHALGKSGAEVMPILESREWLGWRTRAKMTGRGGAVGFQARRSHRVIDVERCLALDPRLDAALQEARAALRDSLGESGTVSGMVAPDGRVQLVVEGGHGSSPETLADQSAALVGRAQIEGVVVRAEETSRYYGAALLELGKGYTASAEGFAQANLAQNDVLRKIVKSWAVPSSEDAPPRVLELYAGDGNFTRDLVRRARVVAVEGDRHAAARLADNLRAIIPRGMGTFDRWAVRAESAATAVRKLAGESFDVVVLDPPRAGAVDLVPGVAALGASRIVYVSCDPMTLARDLERFAQQSYRAIKAQPLDMMPHTSHIEVVCLIERA
jgi:23S rRNA (uracil1939-C5)-methyltransferase